jgi:hypothetical protein
VKNDYRDGVINIPDNSGAAHPPARIVVPFFLL